MKYRMLLPGWSVRLLHLKLVHKLLPVIQLLFLEPLNEKFLADIVTEVIDKFK